MKNITTELAAWSSAFCVAMITPDRMMEDLYNGVGLLLLFFMKGILATLASIAGRYFTMKLQDWRTKRDFRKKNPLDTVNKETLQDMSKYYESKKKNKV
jgi:hypothetical protein